MLRLEGISSYYGNVSAANKISLAVDKKQTVSLIGSNGAGKSTILNTISGIVKPREGKIFFEGQEVQNLDAYKIVNRGIVQVPEGRRIFSNLSVEENLEVGAFTLRDKQRIEHLRQRVYDFFPRLREKKHDMGGEMSGGEQQMLAIGRALMADPKILLLDEPSLGLAPQMVTTVFRAIESIKQEGISILLVEQNSKMALKHSNYGYVLEHGQIVLEGAARELLKNPEVQKAYLGA